MKTLSSENIIDIKSDINSEYPTFEQLSEYPPDYLVPRLDRIELDETNLSDIEKQWRSQGVVVLKNFIPHDLIDAYCEVREKWPNPAGWLNGHAYMHVPEAKELGLYPPLMEILKTLLDGDAMMHLNLTSWISTDRTWHQDDYLNPSFVNSFYAACWFALDTIHPDSGPFQYIPGSNRWPILRQDKIRNHLRKIKPEVADATGGEKNDGAHWILGAETFLLPAIEDKIKESKIGIESFLGEKGDVLIWHGRLVHRGSKAKIRGTERKAFISHYSEISHRKDLHGLEKQHTNGSWYAHIECDNF